ncbi:hypothetical protein HC124_05935 [Winkia neuii]|uniref:putative acetyltransferase n=1 Tax=Winkia TaxID=2692118 RepID=UPI001431765A|nr:MULTISPECIES: hypothetical protein [Winkia]MDK7184922.1 hypothetical protein [Winkia sp. UMB1295B]NJJ15760.1 hypothetical protein [Winkia neuii]
MDEKTYSCDSPNPPKLPWLEWKVGERVVLRYREPDGFYDALGEVLQVERDFVDIMTRKGKVRVPAQKMVTGKRVPPRRW